MVPSNKEGIINPGTEQDGGKWVLLFLKPGYSIFSEMESRFGHLRTVST